jgi:hypothetical protein
MSTIKTKRWNDAAEPDDGRRTLICRYRPHTAYEKMTRPDAWTPNLGPSRELHADFHGNHGPPIGWERVQKAVPRRDARPGRGRRRVGPAHGERRAHHAALLLGMHERGEVPSDVLKGVMERSLPSMATKKTS